MNEQPNESGDTQAQDQATPAAPTTAATASASGRRSPRTAPIFWGALFLACCGYVLQDRFGGAGVDATAWIIATVTGLGILLLAVGVAVVLRGRR